MRKPQLVQHRLPVVTMDKLVGREITEVLGEVVGVVARLVEMAEAAGADAVVGLRFDCSEITQSLSEVCAYGTAVKLAGGQEMPLASAAP